MSRLPFEALHREAGGESFQTLADRLGCTPRTLHRWKSSGVPLSRADDAAIRRGSHPACVWPETWLQAA